MMKMTQDELNVILTNHAEWLNHKRGGVKANLAGIDLSWANMYMANLAGADLSGTDLSGASLYRVNLSKANLSGADLTGAHICDADLSDANLTGANLTWADLSDSNLAGANLSDANLAGINLTGVIGLTEQPIHTKIVPETGSFIGWKKVFDYKGERVILKLEIPHDAKRVSSIKSRKCRASRAIVLEAMSGSQDEVFYSSHNPDFTYRVGQTVKPTFPFDGTWLDDCRSGIHFFLTRKEAEEY